jgi:hypothetical protein
MRKQMQSTKAVEDRLSLDPSNLLLVKKLWASLDVEDYNLQNGRCLVRMFREPALSSKEGVVELSRAFRALFELTGEAPRKEFFDTQLMGAMLAAGRLVNDEEVKWLLERLEA